MLSNSPVSEDVLRMSNQPMTPETPQPPQQNPQQPGQNVQPQPNGSLMVTGNLEIISGTGRTTDKVTRVWLCRCGQSKNKPYCDGSHKVAGFVGSDAGGGGILR